MHRVILASTILVALAVAPSFAESFDGVYKGAAKLNAAYHSPVCHAEYPVEIAVSNHHFEFQFNTRKTEADLRDDGSFDFDFHYSYETTIRRVTGRIIGNTATATFVSPTCTYDISLQKG